MANVNLPAVSTESFSDDNINEDPEETTRDQFQTDNVNLNDKMYQLQSKLSKLTFDLDHFKRDKKFTQYYTGFEHFKYVECIFNMCKPFISESKNLSKFHQIILTLIKLRLNLQFMDLGYRFDCHYTTASRIFYKTVDVLYARFKVTKKVARTSENYEEDAITRRNCLFIFKRIIFIFVPEFFLILF